MRVSVAPTQLLEICFNGLKCLNYGNRRQPAGRVERRCDRFRIINGRPPAARKATSPQRLDPRLGPPPRHDYVDDRNQGVSFNLDTTERNNTKHRLQANTTRWAALGEAQCENAGANLDCAGLIPLTLGCVWRLTAADRASNDVAEAEEMFGQLT